MRVLNKVKNVSNYKLFEFTPEIIDRIKLNKEIPVNFYNREGQILIGKMPDASSERIEKLFHFMAQGIYYDEDDSQILGIVEKKEPVEVEGLTSTRLLADPHVDEIEGRTKDLFRELKSSSLKSAYTRTSLKMMDSIYSDFNGQEDAMVGLINILELMKGRQTEADVQKAVKRIVTSMALKTRGMKVIQNSVSDNDVKQRTTDLMMSALFCDVGYFKMNLPSKNGISAEEMNYIRNHPLLSYLMIIHDQTLSSQIKHTVLTHHRPNYSDKNANNYPPNNILINKLLELREKYKSAPSRSHIVKDIDEQLHLFKHNELYREDSNILAISSEFSSLTSNTEWRKAFSPSLAVKMIINNSYFTYTPRIIREFLDYVSISLCDNKKIIREGEFVVVQSQTSKGTPIFELCRVEEVGRYQSRPAIKRIATIDPIISQKPKLNIDSFDFKNMRKDPRKAYYDLKNDDTKRIVYTIGQDNMKEVYDEIIQIR